MTPIDLYSFYWGFTFLIGVATITFSGLWWFVLFLSIGFYRRTGRWCGSGYGEALVFLGVVCIILAVGTVGLWASLESHASH